MFPASLTNDTKQIFITGKELHGVKKSILYGKIYDLIAIIELDKINNWKEIKEQSIWVSASFKDQKEINNNSHLCFPFVTRSLKDSTTFSIYWQDDKNKKIEFNFLLEDIEKNLEEYKKALELRDRQLSE